MACRRVTALISGRLRWGVLPAVVKTTICLGLVLLVGCDASVQPIDPTPSPTPAPLPANPGLFGLADQISEAMFQHLEQFGGKPWYDREGKFLLHVAYVGDEAAARARLAPVTPPNLPVEFHRVKYSYSQLDAVRGEIGRAGWTR